jgi:hypothetical protein
MAAEVMGMNNTRKEEEKYIGRKEWQEGSFPQKKPLRGKLKSPRKEKGRAMPALSDTVTSHTIMASNIYQSNVSV